jgi:hypothetical protein
LAGAERHRELLEVIDMTEFVTAQRNILSVDATQLLTPVERDMFRPDRRLRNVCGWIELSV